eukprot:TRINITY_DN2235_c1_g1_i2.p1 TRINITY_DN2235_c1_g1~~TRINITY_DN2235_c1_g1_i2.p1  ORF type:complete len:259 (+),score=44.26 TRINITY_DN2235_c1_g1_i2:172-948(+)
MSEGKPKRTGVSPRYRHGADAAQYNAGEDLMLSSEDDEEEEMPWIQWFCRLKGNEFFIEVDDEFVQDDFNLTGLTTQVPFYEYALDIILDLESPGEEDLTGEQLQLVESSAETLYGLIHARFILTSRGMSLAQEKYYDATWGRCPRVLCGGQAVIPVGQSDLMREASVKVYCPQCQDLYYPRSSRHKSLDGAFWGTTFPHLFIMCNPHMFCNVPRVQRTYAPKIYGFRVRKEHPQEDDTDRASGADPAASQRKKLQSR